MIVQGITKRRTFPASTGLASILVLLATAHLVDAVPHLQIDKYTCISQNPITAALARYLDILAASAACGDHAYLPGQRFDEFIQMWVAMLACAVCLGVIWILLALGVGIWVVSALRNVRSWISSRFTIAQPAPITRFSEELVEPADHFLPRFHLRLPVWRRGPPSMCF